MASFVSGRRFRDASPEEIEALTLDAMREIVTLQLQPHNVEISLVGDIDLGEVDGAVLRYLGTVQGEEAARQLPAPAAARHPVPARRDPAAGLAPEGALPVCCCMHVEPCLCG